MAFRADPLANPEAIVSGPSYRFTVLTDRLIRYEWTANNQFEDRASTFAINRNFPVPRFRVIHGDELEIITEHFHLIYNKESSLQGGLVVHFNSKHTNWGAPWRYGDPEKHNLGGTARTLDDCDGRCEIGKGIISRAGYAAIDDSDSMLFDGDFVAGRSREGVSRLDMYLFCYGHDYKDAIKAFFALSGKQPVLPRYALGNWWSRYHAYHQAEYIGLMDDFQAHKIPLSVAVVDMDWHLVSHEDVPHSGWTGYTWNKELFPDPEAFGRELHNRDLKISLNDHPHLGVHSHEDAYEEMAQTLGHNTRNKDPILFDPTNPRYMKAYFDILHRRIERTACDFWWIDWQQGRYSKVENLDPLWLLNHFQFIDHNRCRDAPLILSRYAGPGSHRYPVGFSGDTVVSWKSLAFQPEFTATASNIGYGWWSHDIGGHIYGSRDDELVTRWVQLGVFSPIFRLHSSLSRWMSKEPWLYRPERTEVMSEFMRLRHRLVPFLHTQNIICSQEDELLIQPMYWIYPDNEKAYSFPNQYIFGSEFLVAPIVQPRDKRTNLASVKAWLPSASCRYVDLFTGTVYDGNREILLYRRLNEYPVLLTEGTIIPMDAELTPRNGCLNPEALEILVVVGRDAQTVILEYTKDDACLRRKKMRSNAQMTERNTEWTFTKTTITFQQQEGKAVVEKIRRPVTFRFLSLTSIPDGLKVFANDSDVTQNAISSVVHYPETPSLLINCPFVPASSHTITIELGPSPQLSVIDPKPRLERQIMDYQTDFKIKDQLWEVVSEDKDSSLNSAIGTLMSLGYDEDIIGPVAELLMADKRLYS
ncbi:hypothetical protein Plec18167_000948 [Paecilomyces lecythidis]|uniref:alpha-glucosidase n=1 Tax=Paecilomyces lecythidis TaxID=3004212 RepID=A0ABR3YDC0_9EURO